MKTDHHLDRMRQTTLVVIGIDPGPVPGIVRLAYSDLVLTEVEAFQCTAGAAPELVRHLLPDRPAVLVQVETFVSSRRAARSSTAAAGKTTRDLVGQFERVVGFAPFPMAFMQRNAGQVKPWATDARLRAVKTHGTDLLALAGSVGRHARDAARHALFAACHDGGVPDPLSKEWKQ